MAILDLTTIEPETLVNNISYIVSRCPVTEGPAEEVVITREQADYISPSTQVSDRISYSYGDGTIIARYSKDIQNVHGIPVTIVE